MKKVEEKKNFYEKRLKLLDKVVGDLSFQIAVLLNQLGKDKATNRRVWRLVVAMLEDASSITSYLEEMTSLCWSTLMRRSGIKYACRLWRRSFRTTTRILGSLFTRL